MLARVCISRNFRENHFYAARFAFKFGELALLTINKKLNNRWR